MAVTAGLSLLMLMTLPVAARIHTVYFDNDRGRLTLNPNYAETIHNITWRYNGYLLTEYSRDSNLPQGFMDKFENRGNLNRVTGTLTLSSLKKDHGGRFTVEINGKVLPITFNAVGIDNLADYSVEVLVKPKGCSRQTMERCTLVCGELFKDAEPVQYFWKAGKKGEWMMGDKTLSIFFTKDTKELSKYTCKVKNPVSERESEKPIHDENEQPIDEDVEIESGGKLAPVGRSSRPDPMPAVLLVAVLAVGAAVVV